MVKTLVDAGPLVALFDRREWHYEACREQTRTLSPGTLYTCLPVITEAAYLLNRQDSRLYYQLLEAVHDGVYQLLELSAEDFNQVEAITKKYESLGLDFADACLMHLSERENITQIFTLDRRDFPVYRPSSGNPLTLLPAQLG